MEIILARPFIASPWFPVREVNTTAAKLFSGSTQMLCPVQPEWRIVLSERPSGRVRGDISQPKERLSPFLSKAGVKRRS